MVVWMRTQLPLPEPYRRPQEAEVIVLVSFNCQVDSLESPEKGVSTEELPRSNWPMGLSVWVVLIVN